MEYVQKLSRPSFIQLLGVSYNIFEKGAGFPLLPYSINEETDFLLWYFRIFRREQKGPFVCLSDSFDQAYKGSVLTCH